METFSLINELTDTLYGLALVAIPFCAYYIVCMIGVFVKLALSKISYLSKNPEKKVKGIKIRNGLVYALTPTAIITLIHCTFEEGELDLHQRRIFTIGAFMLGLVASEISYSLTNLIVWIKAINLFMKEFKEKLDGLDEIGNIVDEVSDGELKQVLSSVEINIDIETEDEDKNEDDENT